MSFYIYHAFQRLLSELLKKLDAELKHEICHWAAYYVSSLTFSIMPIDLYTAILFSDVWKSAHPFVLIIWVDFVHLV